jgi:hypothetical protein
MKTAEKEDKKFARFFKNSYFFKKSKKSKTVGKNFI